MEKLVLPRLPVCGIYICAAHSQPGEGKLAIDTLDSSIMKKTAAVLNSKRNKMF